MASGSFAFEICVSSPQGCSVAEKCGADRVELCAALTEGGTTPSAGCMAQCRKICKNSLLHVIIRPRGGDFLYSEEEILMMEYDIKEALRLGADGIVLGCLNKEGNVDCALLGRLLEQCKGKNVTFHRAFDAARDQKKALEDIIAVGGINRILTSGGEADAFKGAVALKELNELAAGRITLLAGAGVSPDNIGEIFKISGVREFHFSGKSTVRSIMEYHNPKVFMGLPGLDEYALQVTGEEKVRETMEALLIS